MPEIKLLFSQSLMKRLLEPEVCPLAIKYRYIDGIETDPSDLMFKGLYFEHHLLGATRGGFEPVFPPLARGGTPAAKSQLDELIIKARRVMIELDIFDPATGRPREGDLVQPHLTADDEEGHIDLIAADFKEPTRRAVYDVKYTETALDDRWNGWANFDDKWGEKFQAIHYINLYFEAYGRWVPFYFLIFGKAGWVRVLKLEITELGLELYRGNVNRAKDIFKGMKKARFPATPEFNKCNACPYALAIYPDPALARQHAQPVFTHAACIHRALIPEIETFQI